MQMATADLLSHTTLFLGMAREALDKLALQAGHVTYRRGDFLWRAGETPPVLAVVQKGLVKEVRHGSKNRAICGLVGPTESIGDHAVVCGVPSPADAIAASESVSVITLPREEVRAAFARDPKLFLSLACAVEKNVEALLDKIDVLSAGSVEARLATLLLKLNGRFGDDYDDGTSEIPVALSRRDLAELVATSFETAIRVMSRWEREGLLETTRRGFTLRDVNRLASLSGAQTAVAAE